MRKREEVRAFSAMQMLFVRILPLCTFYGVDRGTVTEERVNLLEKQGGFDILRLIESRIVTSKKGFGPQYFDGGDPSDLSLLKKHGKLLSDDEDPSILREMVDSVTGTGQMPSVFFQDFLRTLKAEPAGTFSLRCAVSGGVHGDLHMGNIS